MRCPLLLLAMFAGTVLSASGVSANGASADGAGAAAPQWIWHTADRAEAQAAHLHHAWNLDQPPVRARLVAAADCAEATLYLNGRPVRTLEPYRPALRLDVRRWLTEGRNTIAVAARGTGGPAAVALILEIEAADGTTRVVVTDATWRTRGEAPAGWHEAAFTPGDDWTPARALGTAADALEPDPQQAIRIGELDDYTQWTQASGAEAGADPARFSVPAGYTMELLHSARSEEGSWVSLEFDPQGRLIVAPEEKGLLQMTLPADAGEAPHVEWINRDLAECRGLLAAHDSLYVQANSSRGLYRLRDTDGDDQYESPELLYESPGGLGHGRNDLALGPDGRIYAIFGDAVDLPRAARDHTSPLREHAQGARSKEGHLLRLDAEGQGVELLAAGLRNPYGVAFHPDGEAFTYDADAEFDMGAPWYRPTRIVHLVPGADYGWRGVTGSWPPYVPDHPDNTRPVFDIGKGSPTAVKFGTGSHFPAPYRQALFVLDWAYGRILALHLSPRGGSYAACAETFVKGRPLNVTDLGFGPDGALYLVTGGRKTQSALYRVRYTGPSDRTAPPQPTTQQLAQQEHAAQARALRRRLEELHRPSTDALDVAWPHLANADPALRYAARIAVEHQPVATWQNRALDEPEPRTAIAALLALARAPHPELRPRILARLIALDLEALPPTWQQTAYYAIGLCLAESDSTEPRRTESSRTQPDRIGPDHVEPGQRAQFARRLVPLYPAEQYASNRLLGPLLIGLAAPGAVPATFELLRNAPSQEEQMHALYLLRSATAGWTDALRDEYFAALISMRQYQGGQGMPQFIRQIEADALAAVPGDLRDRYAALLAEADRAEEPLPSTPRPFVREWKMEDLRDSLSAAGAGRDPERGARMFAAALCVRCHRVGPRGSAVGPDLTSVGSRFSRRDILESILDPSRVVAEPYRQAQVVTQDGRVLVGQVIPSTDYRSPTLQIATDPLHPEDVEEIAKTAIDTLELSPTSVMPAGLLNTLTRDEILDLLAWLESAGNARHANVPSPPSAR